MFSERQNGNCLHGRLYLSGYKGTATENLPRNNKNKYNEAVELVEEPSDRKKLHRILV